MLIAFLAALAAAFIFLTFLQTMAAYSTLPDRVPVHMNASGEADGFGPKFMIWLVPLVQVVSGVVMLYGARALASHAPGTHGTVLGATIIAVCVMALTWRVQQLLIASAKSGGQPVPMRGFWVFFAAWMCVVLFDALVIH
ncbi:MAG TPA: DUF1648 domain-containing protein [Candidatus Baltobacteraceae bacterium]